MRSRKSRTPRAALGFSIASDRSYNSRRSAPAQKPHFNSLYTMSACASFSSSSSADANFSNSPSDSDPSSLQGSRWSATSITPLWTCHDSACPWNWLAPKKLPLRLYRLLHWIHLVNLVLHAGGYQVALQLPVGREHPILDREGLRPQAKCPHLLIVRKLWIDRIERRLRLFL